MGSIRINIWAILVASAVVYLLGIVWYGLWAELWASGWGLDLSQIEGLRDANLFDHLISLLVLLLYGWAFSYLVVKLSINTLREHITLGMLLAGLFIIPTMVSDSLFLNARVTAILVDALYLSIRALVFSIIIGFWNKRAVSSAG